MKLRFLIIGTSRSGKTTLARKLLQKNGGIFLDIVDYVNAFLKRANVSQQETDIDLLRIPYEELCRDLENGRDWDILELASDFPEEYLPRIVASSNIPIKLVFCPCPLGECLRRNRAEDRLVPEGLIRHQDRFGEDFYRSFASKLGIGFISRSPDSLL